MTDNATATVVRQLVYSAHEYGPSVFQQPWFSSPQMTSILRRRWEDEFGFIANHGFGLIHSDLPRGNSQNAEAVLLRASN